MRLNLSLMRKRASGSIPVVTGWVTELSDLWVDELGNTWEFE
jgi:hypothetical protein